MSPAEKRRRRCSTGKRTWCPLTRWRCVAWSRRRRGSRCLVCRQVDFLAPEACVELCSLGTWLSRQRVRIASRYLSFWPISNFAGTCKTQSTIPNIPLLENALGLQFWKTWNQIWADTNKSKLGWCPSFCFAWWMGAHRAQLFYSGLANFSNLLSETFWETSLL